MISSRTVKDLEEAYLDICFLTNEVLERCHKSQFDEIERSWVCIFVWGADGVDRLVGKIREVFCRSIVRNLLRGQHRQSDERIE